MSTRFFLPPQSNAASLFAAARRVFGDFSELPHDISIDFSRLNFCRPGAVVFLSNLANYLYRAGAKVSFENMDRQSDAVRFLDDSGFFIQHLGQPLRTNASARATTCPLVEVQHANSHAWIATTFIPWLSVSSGVPQEGFMEMKTCLSELFNNISDHTDLDVGSIFAQWYPRENKVQIAVADFGIGIPSNVKKIEHDLSDEDAIVRAFEEGFSTQSVPQNRGAGLSFLRDNVVLSLNGALRVSSGTGSVRFDCSSKILRTHYHRGGGFCPGTMVEIEFDTTAIDLNDLGEVDFEW